MTILSFLVHIMSGATLLLFSVHFMRTGIERRLGPWVGRAFNDSSSAPALIVKGGLLGFSMQGGTAVLLLAATLASTGTVSSAAATFIAFGAEIGSAVAVNVLHITPTIVGPLMILTGGWLFHNTGVASKSKETGRIILGLGLIFLALSLIRAAVTPLQGSPYLSGALELIGSDPVNAALLGIGLSLLMHSSLVALLTAAALLANSNMPPTIILGLVLGCNIGSAILPLWLLRSQPKAAQVVARSAATLRSAFALFFLVGLIFSGIDRLIILQNNSPTEVLLLGHLAFNAALLLLVPLVGRTNRLFVSKDAIPTQVQLAPSQLQESPELALPEFKRHVNVMLETLGSMIETATATVPDHALMLSAEKRTNKEFTSLRQRFTKLPDLPPQILEQVREMLDYAIRIERCADVLSGKYMNIRREEESGLYILTTESALAVESQLAELKKTMVLAQHVFWKEDCSGARKLVQLKQAMTSLDFANRRNHFEQIRKNNHIALRSSDQYLELTAALKEITSKLATIGYVVLKRHGELEKR